MRTRDKRALLVGAAVCFVVASGAATSVGNGLQPPPGAGPAPVTKVAPVPEQPPAGARAADVDGASSAAAVTRQPANEAPDLVGAPTQVDGARERVAGGQGADKPGGRKDTSATSGADAPGGRTDR